MDIKTNKYSLSDFEKLLSAKWRITIDRFMNYYGSKYPNISNSEINQLFKKIDSIPYDMGGVPENFIDDVLEIMNIIDVVDRHVSPIGKNIEFGKIKVFYSIGSSFEKIIESKIFDFNDNVDVVSYAELLKNNEIEIVSICNQISSISKNKQGWVDVFVGDFFSVKDNYWGVKSNIILVDMYGNFRRLLYIKGFGYLNSDLSPNMDDDKLNGHSVSLGDWERLGNIVTDIHLLRDNDD